MKERGFQRGNGNQSILTDQGSFSLSSFSGYDLGGDGFRVYYEPVGTLSSHPKIRTPKITLPPSLFPEPEAVDNTY